MEQDADFRPLTGHEREVLERLLAPTFPGCVELRAQLAVLVARQTDDHGCLELACREPAPAAPVRGPIPSQGEYKLADGVTLHVWLWAHDGFMSALELVRVGDDVPPHGLPPAREMSVFAPYSEDAGVWNTAERFR